MKYGRAYAAAHQSNPPQPYDVTSDPKLKIAPFRAGEDLAAEITPPSDEAAFCTIVKDLVEQFRWAVEERGMWRSFWTNTS